MRWEAVVLIVFYAVSTACSIATIGLPRRPLTSTVASVGLLITIFLVMLVIRLGTT